MSTVAQMVVLKDKMKAASMAALMVASRAEKMVVSKAEWWVI